MQLVINTASNNTAPFEGTMAIVWENHDFAKPPCLEIIS